MKAALLILLALLLILIPMLLTQFQNLTNRLPQLIDFVQNKALPWFNSHFGTHIPLNKETLLNWLQSHTGTLQNTASKIAPTLMEQGGALASGLSNLALLPLLLYYFLYDWQRWSHGIRALMPRRFIDAYTRIGGEIDEVLGEFLRGQLMVMLIMGVVYGVGLMLTGLDSGFAIGMIAGLLVFIPYLGAFTGLLLAQNISYYAAQPEKCKQILSHVETRLKQEDSLSKKQQTPILPPEGMQPLDSL